MDLAVTRFLTYAQAAAYLALPIGTLRAMVHRKAIPHVRIGPRTVTFELADLDRWIAQHKVANDQAR